MHTNLDFLQSGRQFPPLQDAPRLEHYRQNSLMFDGDHAEVFPLHKDLIRVDRGIKTHEILLNWFERLSTLWADLLVGEEPIVTDADGSQEKTDAIRELLQKVHFWDEMYKVALDISTYGNSIAKVRRNDKGECILNIFKPCFWFPVVSETDATEITAHVLAWVSSNAYDPDPVEQQKPKYLYVEIHTDKAIEYRTYNLINAGGVISGQLSNMVETVTEANPIGENLVTAFSNLQRSGCIYGIDDYKRIASIIDELEVRFAQNAFILDKHGNPRMYGPALQTETDEEGEPVATPRDYFVIPEDTSVVPTYITWDGQLAAAFTQIEKLMSQLYAISETTQSLFDDSKTGANESGTAIRKHLMLPLAKVNRMRKNFDKSTKELIHKLYKLETGEDIQVNIQWQDGLPNDETEELANATKATDNGLISKRTARKKLYNMSDAESEAEEQLIADETPSVTIPEMHLHGDTGADDE